MALPSPGVWAIDIGSNSLKALHLSDLSGSVEVIGFENIQHGKILTATGVKDIERDELIAISLREFVSKHDLSKEEVVISVSSQNSFARFVNLPPVEEKRIPEIVKFEASQQIPFDIDDVQWDWQMMSDPSSPQAKVGIFAIKNDLVAEALKYFENENIRVGYVQMAPMALYNYILHDRPELCKTDSQAVVVLNIGAEITDLVICTRSAVWQRGIPMGGNAFTRAISDTFKLNFEKAEKLKRTAAMSKYARQIFQSMRPVFTDFASEVQRSLGFYSNSNPNVKLVKIIALGGGTKMRGLLQYLQQSLQIPAEMPDSFAKLAINPNVSKAKFHESVGDFGVVYGLALQGLGLGKIESNLLPRSIARSMAWASKAKFFTMAACMLLVVALLSLGKTYFAGINYNSNKQLRTKIASIVSATEASNRNLEQQQNRSTVFESAIQTQFDLFKYREIIPLLHQTIISVLPNEKNNPAQQELYKVFASGDAETVLKIPRKQRKQIFVTAMSASFAQDVSVMQFQTLETILAASRRKSGGGEDSGDGYLPGKSSSQAASYYDTEIGAESEAEAESKSGFLVTITGFSPYENIAELMDPTGVEDDQTRWGFITRLLNLDKVVDSNCPFKLYEKTQIEHFRLDIGEVSHGSPMPGGIGLEQDYDNETKVLVDPMTKEVISKVSQFDESGRPKIDRTGQVVYEINDHWFVLNAKFIWKDAPVIEISEAEAAQQMVDEYDQ